MTNDTQISEREREILRLVATGATNQQIALQLNISVNTVKVHLRNIFGKIGVVSRTEATVYAIRNGLVSMASSSEVGLATAGVDGEPAGLPPVLSASAQTSMLEGSLPGTPDALTGTAALEATPASAQNQALAETRPVTGAPVRPSAGRSWLLPALGATLLVVVLIAGLRWATSSLPSANPTATDSNANGQASSSSSRWTLLSPLPSPRDNFALAAFDLQGEIYLFGGASGAGVSASVDRYDPLNDRWVSLGEKPTPVQYAEAVTLRGKIYLPGGEDANGTVRDLLEIYDPRERAWSNGPPLPAARSRYTLLAWDGQIYLIGGWDGQQVRSEVFIFDPDANQWSAGPVLPSPRQRAGAVVANGRLYLVGGEDKAGPLRDCARLEPGDERERRWSTIVPLPQPMVAPATIAPFGSVQVFDVSQHEAFQYDHSADTWQLLPVADEALLASSTAMLESNIYFITEASDRQPGAVGRYQPVYTIFLP